MNETVSHVDDGDLDGGVIEIEMVFGLVVVVLSAVLDGGHLRVRDRESVELAGTSQDVGEIQV